MRILLVDDEPALRELLRATFEGADVDGRRGRVRRSRPSAHAAAPAGRDRARPADAGDGRRGAVPPAEVGRGDARHPDRPADRRGVGGGAARAARGSCSARAEAVQPARAAVGRAAGVGGRTPLPHMPPKRAAAQDQELVLYARDLRHLLEIERGQRELLQESYLATVTSLACGARVAATRARGAHSQRVKRYAVELLDRVDPERLEREPGVSTASSCTTSGRWRSRTRSSRSPAR